MQRRNARLTGVHCLRHLKWQHDSLLFGCVIAGQWENCNWLVSFWHITCRKRLHSVEHFYFERKVWFFRLVGFVWQFWFLFRNFTSLQSLKFQFGQRSWAHFVTFVGLSSVQYRSSTLSIFPTATITQRTLRTIVPPPHFAEHSDQRLVRHSYLKKE